MAKTWCQGEHDHHCGQDGGGGGDADAAGDDDGGAGGNGGGGQGGGIQSKSGAKYTDAMKAGGKLTILSENQYSRNSDQNPTKMRGCDANWGLI